MKLRTLIAVLVVTMVAAGGASVVTAAALAESRYPEVLEEIRALKPMGGSLFSYTPCDAGPYDASPCGNVIRAFETWTGRHGLPKNDQSAGAFKAYVLGDIDKADRLYAGLVGDPDLDVRQRRPDRARTPLAP